MLRIQGVEMWAKQLACPAARNGVHGIVLALAVAGGGCSTDFRRLEQPTLGLNERAPLPTATLNQRRNAGAPVDRGETWSESGARAPLPPVTQNRPLSDLPQALPNTAGLSKPFDKPKAASPAAAPAGAKLPIAAGETIEVQQGDSLYSISKRHKVAIAALMDINQMKSPNLKPGQKLVLPAAPGARRPIAKVAGTQVASAAGVVPPSIVAAPVVTPAPAPLAAADWTGSYTVKSGDSLYKVALQHKVQLAELQRQNSIADPTKVRPGTIIRVPGTDGAVASATPTLAPAAPRPTQIAAAPLVPSATAGSAVAPKIINVGPVTADAAPTEPATTPVMSAPAAAPTAPSAQPASLPAVEKPAVRNPAPGAASAKFRWPVKGQMLGSYGKRPDGTPSDGIAIGVALGTDVAAAQDGTIAYAGSDLKGYGNLILVRHDGGWVTAYAHAAEILVKRGDTVKRGQTIAKAGQSGGVDKPMVHFELRKDSQPVDPTPHMEKM
jgi:murein DD-endopeptidase MepM/ murein hydrolase activator NlpD